MAKFIASDQSFEKILVETGILTEEQLPYTYRVVIELEIGNIAKITIEQYGDDEKIRHLMEHGLTFGDLGVRRSATT